MMLEHLHIRNLALIDDISLEFSSGINVLTGETGAGKSFIIKALSFVMGEKLGVEIVRPGSQKAQVEALFFHNGKEIILRRELSAETGRSRFYVNDSLSSQEVIRSLRAELISNTSQHAQQNLLNLAFQAKLLESRLDADDLLASRDILLGKIKAVDDEIKAIAARQKNIAANRELLEMQAEEIDKLDPKPGEEEELETKRQEIRSQASMKQNYTQIMAILHGEESGGVLARLQDLERILRLTADARNLAEADIIANFRQDLAHFGNNIPRPLSRKANLNDIEERLFAFAQLKRKLKRSFNQILELKKEIKENLSFLDACALDISSKNREMDKLLKELREVVDNLKPKRREAASLFARKLEAILRDLGFSEYVAIRPEFGAYELWPGINDERGRIYWAPNPGQNPQPLDRIASGGELSRFLLALTTMGSQNDDITYIFDEVDAGVGGITLNKVGEKLESLASTHQIILITHWPQLASRASKHFMITKTVKENNTYTECHPVDGKARTAELNRMAGLACERS